MSAKRNTMKRWHFWFGWSTEKLEAWLEAKAQEGWHLVKADRWLNRFHFVKAPAKQVRICIDYRSGEVPEDYSTLFQDAGWELVAKDLGYYMWRTEYEGAQRPEIFSDTDSLIERNRRILAMLGVALGAQIPAWMAVWLSRLWEIRFGKGLLVAYGAIVLLAIVSVLAIVRHNSKMRSGRL